MVWPFTSSSASPPTKPASTPDGAFIAPDRTSRIKCWAARDDFFACLDRSNIIDAVKDADAAQKACGSEEKDLRRECAESWVKYFKERRVFEVKKAKMIEELKKEGAEEMPEGSALPNGGTAVRGSANVLAGRGIGSREI